MAPLYWFSLVPTGVRVVLGTQLALYVASLVGEVLHRWSLIPWLAVSGASFWNGRYWQVVTHPFLPGNLADLVLNGLMITFVGVYLERRWSRVQLWFYCLVIATGVGLVKVLVLPSSPLMLLGGAPLGMGLGAAWLRMAWNERYCLLGVGETGAPTIALVALVLSLLTMLPCLGVIHTLIILTSIPIGWGYLALRWKLHRAQPSRTVPSERIGRLEL